MMEEEGQVGEEILGPVDNKSIKLKPHCSIGALVAERQLGGYINNKSKGSAFLISPNLLLTAAHNCFDRGLGR
jgi:hypothetical protein